MTDEELRDAARKIWSRFNAHDLDLADSEFAPNFENANALPGTPPGPEGMRQVAERRVWSGCEVRALEGDEKLEAVVISGRGARSPRPDLGGVRDDRRLSEVGGAGRLFRPGRQGLCGHRRGGAAPRRLLPTLG